MHEFITSFISVQEFGNLEFTQEIDMKPGFASQITISNGQSCHLAFGLERAPFLFQKAMWKIFRFIMANALVSIDDILLFEAICRSNASIWRYDFSKEDNYNTSKIGHITPVIIVGNNS